MHEIFAIFWLGEVLSFNPYNIREHDIFAKVCCFTATICILQNHKQESALKVEFKGIPGVSG